MIPNIREATRSDLVAVLRFWMESGAEPTHTDDVESIGALIARDPEALIVAESESQIVGTVIAGWDGWRGSIYRSRRPAPRTCSSTMRNGRIFGWDRTATIW